MKRMIYFTFALILMSLTYAQPFNTTPLDTADNIYEFTTGLNTLTNGSIGIGLLLLTFVITYVIISGTYLDALAGVSAGAFITGLGAVILLPLGLIPFHIYKFVLVATACAMLASVLLRK
jgi:hypothetical protein